MGSLFTVAAIPRRDGSPGDGVHLLWTAPPASGYSVGGWDVQRRDSVRNTKPSCYQLSQSELDVLHGTLRLSTPFGLVGLRAAQCPELPALPPDEPSGDDQPPRTTCVDLTSLRQGRGPNPRPVGRLVIEVDAAPGVPALTTTVVDRAGLTGLDVGVETRIAFSEPTSFVEVTLAHWSGPAVVEAFEADGSSAGRRRTGAAQGTPERVQLSGRALARVVVRAPSAETSLLRCCVAVKRGARPGATGGDGRGLSARAALPVAALDRAAPSFTSVGTTTGTRCLAYDIRLGDGHRWVEVEAGVPGALVIALRDDKAVEARVLADPSGLQTTRFENRDVDQVLLYCSRLVTSLTICLDTPADQATEDAEWAREPFIVTGLQVPVKTLDPALTSDAAEDAMAASRLLPGETFDQPAFRLVSAAMNEAAADAAAAAPVHALTVVREDPADPLIEMRTWPYALAMLVDPAWRRMLGFAFLDHKALVPGQAYDYRVTGRFHRRDLEERLHGFHIVPRGTTLPTTFFLGPVELATPEPAVVEHRPAVAPGGLRSTGRAGISLSGQDCLRLSFAVPLTSVVLELEPGSALTWTAVTTDFLGPLPLVTSGGSLPGSRRVTIDTAGDPVDTIVLSGTGFLHGVRETTVAATAGSKPDDVLSRSVVLQGVVFQDTPAPAPPTFLGTTNLQSPVLPADLSTGPPSAPPALGFRLSWLPPSLSGAPTVPWPPDLGAFPPFDVLGFRIERRRTDVPGPFTPVGDGGRPELVFGSRSGRREPPALTPGIDLEAAFPDPAPPTPPVPVFMSIDDVLVTAEHGGPPPGSLHQYRAVSVDAIGRSSAPRTGTVVRLEKHEPPPQPVGPPDALPVVAPAPLQPAGVRARVVQSSDPDAVASDLALLGPAGAVDSVVVLEWGWTQAERDRDPHASEFRVYWQPDPPDLIRGQLTGTAALVAGVYEISATLDRVVAADAMAGRFVRAPEHPFRVVGHSGGQTVVLRLAPSPVSPTQVPGPGVLELRPVLDGSEQRPPAWRERVAVVPVTAADGYRTILADPLVVDPTRPLARAWVGVSCADAQSYVADAVPVAAPLGNRPGNESAIVAVPVEARYRGRPDFVVPALLPDVPEVVTREPAGETVTVDLDLPALLPAVVVPAGHRVLVERLGLASVVACLSARPDGTIGFQPPGAAPATAYTLANPADQADLLAQIRTGTPAQVEGRFLLDALLRHGAGLETLWRSALPLPVPMGRVVDTLPHQAERHVHRVRLADAAGHLSAAGAVLPQIVRVPSLRSPAPPTLRAPSSTTDRLAVEVRARDAFDLAWVVVFRLAEAATTPAGIALTQPAQLLRLPNRRDLYPLEGIRLRLADGRLLVPAAALAASAGTADPPDRVMTVDLTVGHDQRVGLWTVAMTRDGITSRIAGPTVALSGASPLTVPALAVTSAAGTAAATWTATDTDALYCLQRSLDAGTTWSQVTPWLADTVSTYSVPSVQAGAVYRLGVRASRGRRLDGPTVVPT